MSLENFSFGLLEVADTYVFNMKAMVIVLFFVFAIIAIGYLVGRITIKGISLGTAAIFLVALVAGHLKGMAFGENGYTGISGWVDSLETVDTYFNFIQNFGLILFVTSVGLIAGPSFFKNLRKNAKSYVLLGVIIIACGSLVCLLVTLFVPGMTSAMSVGLLSGALTSTPAYAAAQTALEGSEYFSDIAVGHAVAYPFGVIGVVLFVQIIPKVTHADMDKERALLESVSDQAAENEKSKSWFQIDKFGLGAFALTVICGLLLGSINIPLGNGSSFSLGTTGGPLIMGLIFGHFGHIGKLSLKVDENVLSIFQELGLVFFLIGAGVDGGTDFVSTLSEYGGWVFLWGALMTLIPLLIGYLVATKVLKLSLFNALGSLTGGMTSTPALGALINTTGTANVASAYAATYPISLVLVVLASQFLTYVPSLVS